MGTTPFAEAPVGLCRSIARFLGGVHAPPDVPLLTAPLSDSPGAEAGSGGSTPGSRAGGPGGSAGQRSRRSLYRLDYQARIRPLMRRVPLGSACPPPAVPAPPPCPALACVIRPW